ncbi:hypothetical protein SAMN05444064_1572 [Pseudomonas syringae]|nr:hypothetical protein SAMN05444514_1572 [Pseudomonas syringae]SFM86904.1 hypothetical protein SAMN05444064_1572 [Pseudomonas syringae]
MAVSSIADINAKYQYDDRVSGGNGDGDLVSCGQHGTYNELSYIYTTYLKPLIAMPTGIPVQLRIRAWICRAKSPSGSAMPVRSAKLSSIE